MRSLLHTWTGRAAMLLAGIAVVLAADSKQGFDEASVAKWLQGNSKLQKPAIAPEGESLLETLKPIGEFRKAAAEDPKAAFAKYATNESAIGFLVLSEVYTKVPKAWSYFFRGSVIIASNLKSDVVRTAFYNPFVDAVIVLDWNRSTGRIVSGALSTTTTFLNLGKPSLRPQWVGASGQYDLMLRDHCKNVIAAFEKQNPPLGESRPRTSAVADQSLEVQIVEARLTVMLGAIQQWLTRENGDSLLKPVSELVGAISNKDESNLRRLLPADNPISSSEVAALPEPIRASLRPVYFLADSSTVLVFLQAQEATSFFATAYYDLKNKQLKGLTFLTVMQTQERVSKGDPQ